jgi:hypothetical protein
VNFVSLDGRYCGEPEDTRTCDRCLARDTMGLEVGPVADWRRRSLRLLQAAQQVVVPSADVARRLAKLSPELKVQVEPHEEPPPARAIPRPLIRQGETLRVLTIGAISRIKGYEILHGLAEVVRLQAAPVNLALLGYSADDTRLAASGVEMLGRYFDNELQDKIAAYDPHVILVPIHLARDVLLRPLERPRERAAASRCSTSARRPSAPTRTTRNTSCSRSSWPTGPASSSMRCWPRRALQTRTCSAPLHDGAVAGRGVPAGRSARPRRCGACRRRGRPPPRHRHPARSPHPRLEHRRRRRAFRDPSPAGGVAVPITLRRLGRPDLLRVPPGPARTADRLRRRDRPIGLAACRRGRARGAAGGARRARRGADPGARREGAGGLVREPAGWARPDERETWRLLSHVAASGLLARLPRRAAAWVTAAAEARGLGAALRERDAGGRIALGARLHLRIERQDALGLEGWLLDPADAAPPMSP